MIYQIRWSQMWNYPDGEQKQIKYMFAIRQDRYFTPFWDKQNYGDGIAINFINTQPHLRVKK